MVIDEIQIKQMSRVEKLQVMEFLWKDLSHEEEALPSPNWHENLLSETEKRFKDGDEIPVDWKLAKQQLRENH